MKAIFLERYGPPEVLVEREVRAPRPGANEVTIRVRASGINFADLLQRAGLYANAPRLPYIPGFEVAGEVAQAGEQVTRFQPGDRVVALTRKGGYAEEVSVLDSAVTMLPGAIGYEQAAALPVNYLTAWFCLFSIGHLQPSERVLIHGGAGGVGIAAIQLAQTHKAELFATAGSEEKVKFLEGLGVEHAINYRSADFLDEIRALTEGRGVDLVLDPVGGETLRRSYRLLAPLGRVVCYGLSSALPGKRRNWIAALGAWWRTPRFNPLRLIGRNVGVFGFHLALLRHKQDQVAKAFDQILEMTTQGILCPVIAATFPLTAQGAIDAHRYLHERRNIGKVLLTSD